MLYFYLRWQDDDEEIIVTAPNTSYNLPFSKDQYELAEQLKNLLNEVIKETIKQNEYNTEKLLNRNLELLEILKKKDKVIETLIHMIQVNDGTNAKKWIEKNLFGKEVFKIRLEAYIKNKTDVLSFIKNEIEKIINNEYCDYMFSKSCKEIENQYDEHMKYIENL